MQRIDDYPAACQCGWRGTVNECIPDIDGGGNLGCPECNRIINIVVISPEQKKPGPSETKDGIDKT